MSSYAWKVMGDAKSLKQSAPCIIPLTKTIQSPHTTYHPLQAQKQHFVTQSTFTTTKIFVIKFLS
jgi:hypothetical protein